MSCLSTCLLESYLVSTVICGPEAMIKHCSHREPPQHLVPDDISNVQSDS